MEQKAYRCVFSNDKVGIKLYQTNCLEFMDTLIDKFPEGKFDMIFADPPYFLSNGGITCQAGKMVRVNKGDWDKTKGAKINHEFNLAWISGCQKLLKPNGTIWVSGTQHVIHSVGFAMQQLQMKILNNISWEKPNPPPNLSCRYFTHSTETIIWAAKNEKSKHVFNYTEMRKQNGGKQMKTVWNIKSPYKWEKKYGKHPTQKPIELLDRMIIASTKPGDLIFDPFSGSATTGISAIRNKRQFIGNELETEYIKISLLRIKDAISERQNIKYKPYKKSIEQAVTTWCQ